MKETGVGAVNEGVGGAFEGGRGLGKVPETIIKE